MRVRADLDLYVFDVLVNLGTNRGAEASLALLEKPRELTVYMYTGMYSVRYIRAYYHVYIQTRV